MAKLSIRITHVAWRDGRPRFVPGPKLRTLKFRGEDLKHPGGAWLNAEEALAWSQRKEQEIARRRADVEAARAKGRRAPVMRRGAVRHLTVEELFEEFFETPRMKGAVEAAGKRTRKPAAPATIADYRKKRDVIRQFDAELFGDPVDALTRQIVYDLYERLWEARGLATARGVVAVLSAAITWGMNKGRVKLAANPCLKLGMEMPEPRVRAGTPEEIRHLVDAADRLGRPEIGDAIVLGVWTGQRQNDRLALVDVGLFDGRRRFRQNKTRAIVEIPEAPELAARLAAARERRASWKTTPLELIVDELQRLPWNASHYRHTFKAIRDAAAAGDAAHGLAAMPSLADFRESDCRDTAVTWLARAGCTPIEIAQITGHSLASVHTVLKHYLAQHREIGDRAIAKAIAWYEAGATG